MTVLLEPEIESQFEEAAQQTGESKDSLIRKALLSYLEDLHDARIAEERLRNPGKRIPLSDVVKNLDLDDVDD
jgi:RHH-type rel operon transcriptional repressor/antitoxin RelB